MCASGRICGAWPGGPPVPPSAQPHGPPPSRSGPAMIGGTSSFQRTLLKPPAGPAECRLWLTPPPWAWPRLQSLSHVSELPPVVPPLGLSRGFMLTVPHLPVSSVGFQKVLSAKRVSHLREVRWAVWAPELGCNGEGCTQVSTGSFQWQRCICVCNLRSEDRPQVCSRWAVGRAGQGCGQSLAGG